MQEVVQYYVDRNGPPAHVDGKDNEVSRNPAPTFRAGDRVIVYPTWNVGTVTLVSGAYIFVHFDYGAAPDGFFRPSFLRHYRGEGN